ncbi:MAG: metallophosphoesterase [Actinomycetota bacterium]|nr:metallophosphoesterase [Actinomycetota bacterium]
MSPLDLGPAPPPIRHAPDREKLRQAEQQVRGLLSPEARQRALRLSSRRALLALRSGASSKGSPELYMPRDAYLSHVQVALEQRLEYHRLEGSTIKGGAPGVPQAADGTSADLEGPQAADGTSAGLGDQLFDRFGPDDWEWMKTVVEAALTAIDGGKHAFGMRPAEYRLGSRTRIVLVADWGTGTPRARKIAALARQRLDAEPAIERHVIHLGDVYYCGLPEEYRTRFLDLWPASRDSGVMSWNLNGNHDMYSGGQGYYSVISAEPFAQQQGTSCFRLYNEHWQFIALDTAYADNDLHDAQLPWVKRWVGVDEVGTATGVSGARGPRTVLLSHHQLGSAKDQKSVGRGIRDKTAAVRKSGRVHAWFWGHEHRCALYEPYLEVECPVCLGNGGVPELLSPQLTLAGGFGRITGFITDILARFKPRVPAPRVRYQPPLPDTDADGLEWAKLGFVVVDVDGASGRAVYVDEDDAEVDVDLFGAGAA